MINIFNIFLTFLTNLRSRGHLKDTCSKPKAGLGKLLTISIDRRGFSLFNIFLYFPACLMGDVFGHPLVTHLDGQRPVPTWASFRPNNNPAVSKRINIIRLYHMFLSEKGKEEGSKRSCCVQYRDETRGEERHFAAIAGCLQPSVCWSCVVRLVGKGRLLQAWVWCKYSRMGNSSEIRGKLHPKLLKRQAYWSV